MYWEIALSQIKLDSSYFIVFWSRVVSSVIRLMIIYYFWTAVYENKSQIKGMPLDIMLTYIFIATLLVSFVFGGGTQLAGKIKDGSIAIELMRPYDPVKKILALDLGNKVTVFFRDALPIIIIAYVFIDINNPENFITFLYFVVSGILGVTIGKFFDLIMGICAFWTTNDWGLRLLKGAIINFFSGALIPITFFPEWLYQWAGYLPFSSMIYIPSAIYTGSIVGKEMYLAIAMQFMWVAVLYLVAKCLWMLAIRKITIFGG